MKPKRIILIRHGESEGNVYNSIYGEKPDYTLELTPKGKLQAQKTGLKLKEIVAAQSTFFYVSPFWRARMTFEEIARVQQSEVHWIEEPRLREQEWGHLRSKEECARIDRERDGYGTFYYWIPDGESAADVYDRVSDFLNTLHRNFCKEESVENVILVTHGMTIRLFLMRWFHWTVEEFEQLANPANGALVILEQQANGKYGLLTSMKTHQVHHHFQKPVNLQTPKSKQ